MLYCLHYINSTDSTDTQYQIIRNLTPKSYYLFTIGRIQLYTGVFHLVPNVDHIKANSQQFWVPVLLRQKYPIHIIPHNQPNNAQWKHYEHL